MKRLLLAFVLLTPMPLLAAATPVLDGYRAAAGKENAAFKDFSATRGEALYRAKTGDMACASCHGASPKDPGRHATTGKDMLPLAPSANPARFTDSAKVEKWFRRNCSDVLKRACTAGEKGDFITYVSSVR
jgi:mono/diheme cytochrome c family protein